MRSCSLPLGAEPARASIWVIPFRGVRVRSRSARSPRGQVFGLYRSEAFVFAPARSLRLRASRSAQDDKDKYRSVLFYNVICKCGHRRLAYGGSPFAPALVSTSLKMTEAKYRSARLAAGRGRTALPRRSYARQRIVILKRYTPRADEERPYLSSQSLILPLLNVISTEALA